MAKTAAGIFVLLKKNIFFDYKKWHITKMSFKYSLTIVRPQQSRQKRVAKVMFKICKPALMYIVY